MSSSNPTLQTNYLIQITWFLISHSVALPIDVLDMYLQWPTAQVSKLKVYIYVNLIERYTTVYMTESMSEQSLDSCQCLGQCLHTPSNERYTSSRQNSKKKQTQFNGRLSDRNQLIISKCLMPYPLVATEWTLPQPLLVQMRAVMSGSRWHVITLLLTNSHPDRQPACSHVA